MARTITTIPEERLALYDKLLSEYPGIERKGAGMPYTSHNGNMFTFLNPEGELALCLPEEERAKFIDKYKTGLFEAHGTVLKEYVHVPESLFRTTNDLRKYLELSFEYVKTLKSKKK